MLDFCRSSSGAVEDRLEAAHLGGVDVEVKGCADVWVEEMRYRMAVAFLSSVWEKCSSELSKLFLSMKDAECKRRTPIANGQELRNEGQRPSAKANRRMPKCCGYRE